LIQEGISLPNLPPLLSQKHQTHSQKEIDLAKEILEDYLKSGAVKRVEREGTKHLVPWFILSKQEGGGTQKHRLISDCRELNQFVETKRFRLENLQSIFPFLKKGDWGAKIDLKDAYFHIPLSQDLKPFLRMEVGGEYWEFQAGCFGLNVMPHIFMQVVWTLEKKWRSQGIIVFIYLDDILLLGATRSLVQKNLTILIQDILEAGFKVNTKKSILEPTQLIHHLGFDLNLQVGKLQISPQKLKMVKKELGKLVTKDQLTCRKMASILGQVRSFLVALPFLRAFTDTLCQFVNISTEKGWNYKQRLPLNLKDQLKEIKDLLDNWGGDLFKRSTIKNCTPILQPKLGGIRSKKWSICK
jgi:hypothetical protein